MENCYFLGKNSHFNYFFWKHLQCACKTTQRWVTENLEFPRASNNFLVGSSQIVQSNLFLLGHIPFFGQTNIDYVLSL